MSKMFNYEADHIHDLVHPNLLTDSTHYVSECKDIILTEANPNYPKLTDYESEWLYFYEHEYQGGGDPVNLEYQTLVFDHQATVDNAIPYKYKRASLKGQTLVNLVNDVTSNEVGNYTNSPCKINVIRNLQNETLTIIFNVISLEIPDGADGILRVGGGWSGQIRCQPTLGVNRVLYNYNQTSNSWLGVFSNSGSYNLGQRITISDVMVLEGDYTNIDIPYFEGMKSVQMPVLTTTGKNLFDGKLEMGDIDINDGIKTNGDYAISKNFNVIKGGVDVVCSIDSSLQGRIYYYDSNKKYISSTLIVSLEKTPKNAKYFKIRFMKEFLNSNIMMEYGTSITSYEPYHQPNILTINEDVTLRGVGEVQDELNLLTGEVTQRIGEIVLDGSENWDVQILTDNARGTLSGFPNTLNTAYSSISNNFLWNDVNVGDKSGQRFNGGNLLLSIPLTLLTSNDAKGFKEWLNNNNTIVQYKYSTESIKTVNLNNRSFKPFEGTNHYYTSSDTIPPSCELSVPIESTGAQTLMEINQED